MAALNWTMLDDKRHPIPLPEEMTIKDMEAGAEFTLTIPDAPPEGSAESGGSGGEKKMKAKGQLVLTDQRVSVAVYQNMVYRCL